MSEVEDRGSAPADVGMLPVARPVGLALPYARPAGFAPAARLILNLSRRAALAEVILLVVLFTGLQVAKETVLFAFLGDAPEAYRHWTPAVIIGTGVLLVVIVLALAGWRRQCWPTLGLTLRKWPVDAGLGVLGALGVLLLVALGSIYVQIFFPWLVPLLGESQENISEALPPMSLGTIVLLTAVVAFYEELLFRGFVLPRLRLLTGSWWSAILLGAAAFGVLHFYEGAIAVILVMGLAVFLSVLFVWRGSLMAPVVTHFLFNMVQLILLQSSSGTG